MREPSQVFQLLETLYAEFDEIARCDNIKLFSRFLLAYLAVTFSSSFQIITPPFFRTGTDVSLR